MKLRPPLGKKLGTIRFFKKQILCVIGKEMDFGVTNLNIVHVRVLINPKKNLNPGPTPTLSQFPNKTWEFPPQILYPPPIFGNFPKYCRFYFYFECSPY